jgi:hypothetical protein
VHGQIAFRSAGVACSLTSLFIPAARVWRAQAAWRVAVSSKDYSESYGQLFATGRVNRSIHGKRGEQREHGNFANFHLLLERPGYCRHHTDRHSLRRHLERARLFDMHAGGDGDSVHHRDGFGSDQSPDNCFCAPADQ